jgi:hypothetical protein
MSATLLVLVALPCILVIFDDVRGVAHYLWFGRQRPEEGGAAQGPAPDLHGASER